MIKYWLLRFIGAVFIIFSFNFNALAIAIYGHRGARGLSPENTMPAYQTALALGVDYVDMDIDMTKDGKLVVCHNFRLNPDITRNAQGQWIKKPIAVKNLTLKQLQTYNVGEIKPDTLYYKLFPDQWRVSDDYMPSLQEVVDYVNSVTHGKVGFQIEIKTTPVHPGWTNSPKTVAAALAKFIEKNHIADRTQVQSFDWRALIAIQKDDPNIQTAYLTYTGEKGLMLSPDPKIAGEWTAGHLLKNYDGSIPKMIKALGGKLWDPQDTEITQQDVEEAHKLGLKIVVWPWRQYTSHVKVPLLEKMINYHVDGIITDRPDILRGLMAARGLKVPQSYPVSGKSYQHQ